MVKEIINICQATNWYGIIVSLAIVLVCFKCDKKYWNNNIWKFIVNWWILAIFVLIEIFWYIYLTIEKNNDAIHLFMQITPAITMTLFVGLLSRKTAVDNRKLQQDIAENNQLTQNNIAVDNRNFQKLIAFDNQLLQQMNNLEMRKSAAILQLTSEKQQQINNGVVELTDVAIEWDAVYGRFGNKIDRLTVISKIQNIIDLVYKTEHGAQSKSIEKKGNGIYSLATKLSNIRLNDKTIELKSACLKGVNLSNINLMNINLNDAELDIARLIRVNFNGAQLENSSLISAELNSAQLTQANLSNANLTSTDFTGANLSCATLEKAVIEQTNFTSATLVNVDLTETRLKVSNKHKLGLANAYTINLTNANLTNAILSGLDLTGAVLTKTNLTNAILKDAKITDTPENRKLLTKEQQNDVIWVPST